MKYNWIRNKQNKLTLHLDVWESGLDLNDWVVLKRQIALNLRETK